MIYVIAILAAVVVGAFLRYGPRKGSAYGVLAIGIFVVARYSWLTATGQIHPVFATWLFICLGCSVSFWTYWSTKEHSIIGNIGNAVDFIGNWLIFVVVVALGHDVRFMPNLFEVGCLISVVVVFAMWRFTNWHAVSNYGIQVIMTIAYLPMIYHLWYASENTEPFTAWGITWVAIMLSFIPAIMDWHKNKLAVVYNLRRFVLISTTLGLMYRLT